MVATFGSKARFLYATVLLGVGWREGARAMEDVAERDVLIVVGKNGDGDFTSLRAAVAFSQPGDIIEIRDSAVYPEDVILPATTTEVGSEKEAAHGYQADGRSRRGCDAAACFARILGGASYV